MGADKLMLGVHFIHTFITLIVRYADWSVYFRHLAKLLDIVVHLLVCQDWQSLIVFERYILVLVKNGACHIVQFDTEGVRCFYSCD